MINNNELNKILKPYINKPTKIRSLIRYYTCRPKFCTSYRYSERFKQLEILLRKILKRDFAVIDRKFIKIYKQGKLIKKERI